MFKIIKREDLTPRETLKIRTMSIIASIVFSGIFIAILGYNPIKIFTQMFLGSVGTKMRLQETINRIVPLIITSLGILVAFKMKFWNIGAEGQITMGAFGAAYVALSLGDRLSKPITLILMAIASVVCAGIWALIPAFFKTKFSTNETIFTLMLNYVAIKFIQYLQYGPWKDQAATGFPKIPNFPENARMAPIGGINVGFYIAIILTILTYVFLKYTKKGYEIEVVGESINTARYAGMSVTKIILFAITISGGLCGLTGMIQASTMENTLTYNIAGGYGYTAIITCWLSGLNPLFILLTSSAFAILIQGGSFVQITMQVPSSVSGMIQGILLFFILGSEFFIKYRLAKVEKTLEQKGV